MSTLCYMCSQIPASFFAPHVSLTKDLYHRPVDGPRWLHWPVDLLQESATRGCPLCVIFAGTVDADFLPADVRQRTQTCLRRGLLGPHESRSPEEMGEAEISPMSSFALYVGRDDIGHGFFFQIPRDRNLPPPLASPAEDVSLGTQWLADCLESHPKCAAFASEHAPTRHAPTRLLHLSAFPGNDLDFQLVETADLARLSGLRYATLSHRWGDVPETAPWITTRTSLHRHQVRIEHNSMTNTFRDAVRICRGLGIEYLWIDSLCIIQHSAPDWEQESSLMGNVYMGSVINLAACSSEDGEGGCRRDCHNSGRTEASRYYDLDISGSKFRIFERGPRSWDDTYEATQLHKRGWVVQERELAPRAMYYCKDILLWECKTSRGSSEVPWFGIGYGDQEPDLLFNSIADAEPYDDSLAGPFYKPLDISPTSRALGMRHYWFSLVEQYSAKLLTRESDRLPALDGLAQASDDPIKGEYLAGMWRAEMPSALLWRIVASAAKPVPPRKSRTLPPRGIPSWSWASAEYGVTYDSQRSWQAHNSQADRRNLQRGCDFGTFSIREARVRRAGENRTSEILGGSLHCSGVLFSLTVGEIVEPYRSSNHFVSVCSPDGLTVGVLYPDVKVNQFELPHIAFTPVRSELGGFDGVGLPSDVSTLLHSIDFIHGTMCMGLGMVRVSSTGQKYRRIGLLRYVRKDALQESPVVDFEIV